jgi:ribonuclease HI
VGGWAAVIVYPDGERKGIQGHYKGKDVTNNKMELTAVIEGLKFVAHHHPNKKIAIVSDSEYIVKGVNEWSAGWVRKGWKCTTGPVKNKELWVELLSLAELTKAEFTWVRGHDGDENNEIADKLCVAAYKELLK